MGVLTVFNTAVPVVQPTVARTAAVNASPTVTTSFSDGPRTLRAPHAYTADASTTSSRPIHAPVESAGFSILGRAYAQPVAKSDVRISDVWIFLNGPTTSKRADTQVYLYPSNGGETMRYITESSFLLALPAGKYRVEVAHPGFRTATFNIEVTRLAHAYHVPLNAAKFEGLSNMFGPQTARVGVDDATADKFLNARIACERRDIASAHSSLTGVKRADLRSLSSQARAVVCGDT
jgi:hypothetical protein